MEKLSTILMLYLLGFATEIPTALGFDKRPGAVHSWLKNLPNLKEKVALFHFYLHDIIGGNNPTSYTVAEAKISATSPTHYGLIRVMDDPLTIGPEPDSNIIGRVQGTNGGSSLEEIGLLMILNFLFVEGEYNGSTLSVLGRDALLDEYREMPIVGGTGVFRLARGIITAQTVWFNMTTEDAVLELTATVLYYE
ncbi:hypothetical protein C2S53_010328 [Perilla frutescens var. hirtella]|uniref:Dirigent protein n=1 Tax=Perilla frutescens var. hirtella TaxID=608512 RepID=A0AAD4NZQ8_PERFH|nr:hypothetical protein C2S53_010328 [Perilla frutescens var. hirtella]